MKHNDVSFIKNLIAEVELFANV